MSRTNNEFRRQMFRKVGRGFWRNAHAPISHMEPDHVSANTAEPQTGAYPGAQDAQNAGRQSPPAAFPMTTPDQLPEIPDAIHSALAIVTDAVNRGAWRQVMDRCRILSDAAMREWIEQDRAATEAAANINPPEIR